MARGLILPINYITCLSDSSSTNSTIQIESNLARMTTSTALAPNTLLNTPMVFGNRQTQINNSTVSSPCLPTIATGSCQIGSRIASQNHTTTVPHSMIIGLGVKNSAWSHVFFWITVIEILCLLK